MADPNNPTNPTNPTTPANPATQLSTVELIKQALASKDLNTIIQAITQSYEAATKSTIEWTQSLVNSNLIQDTLSGLTKNNIDGISLFTTKILGASTAFDKFSQNIGEVNTFSAQLNNLTNDFGELGSVAEAVAKKIGVPQAVLNAGSGAIGNWLGKIAASADSALKLQNGFIEMAGATGDLGRVFTMAGGNLENLNDMMLEHRVLIDNIAESTGSTAAITSEVYKKLGSIYKGAADEQVSAGQEVGETINMTDAAMKLATGTGRSYDEMTTDLATAWKTYGLEGDKALSFTQRMSDLSSNLGVNLDITRGFLDNMANTFKTMSVNGDQAADTFNKLYPALKETGLSASVAAEMTGKVVQSVSKLSVAQEALISQRGGGPGGLRGAMQFENLINTGQTDKAYEMMKKAPKVCLAAKFIRNKKLAQANMPQLNLINKDHCL